MDWWSILHQSEKLNFIKSWIPAENVVELTSGNVDGHIQEFDLIGLDLDGDDGEFWRQVLAKYGK